MPVCEDVLTPESFYDLRNRTIYEALLELWRAGKPIDITTAYSTLKAKGVLESVGGIGELSRMADGVPAAANLPYYVEILAEKQTLRKVIKTSYNAITSVYEASGKVSDLVDGLEREFLAIRQTKNSESEPIKAVCHKVIERIEALHGRNGAIGGLSTGLEDVDRLTDGLHGGEMIVLAAFPSVGKTAFAMQIAMHQAKLKLPVAVFSCEMRAESLMTRAVCAESRVNLYHVRDGIATQGDFDRMAASVAMFSKLSIHIENSSGWTINQVVAKARRLKKQHGIGLFVVDYLQLLSSDAGSREQEISTISKGLKSIAMESNVPLIALSQLNDDGKLRESRAIGQDADSVWKLEMDGERQPNIQPIKLNVEKNREGAVGYVPLTFVKSFTRFELAAKIDEADFPKNS
jgi:replicative DNA helicase